ncbi:MAG TPA: PPC domain-containing DNA-binding protein [Nitrolancea sp.]|nr:PPC domain-containing DNA-binding protein [Nitrolancea sp.]
MKAKLLSGSSTSAAYVVIFDTGDEFLAGLTAFAREQHLDASHFTAIGGFSRATLGYFDVETKEYRPIPLQEQVEVLSLSGDITLDRGEPKVHAHVVAGKSDGSTCGGHVLEAFVRPTLEVMLEESPAHLRRAMDDRSGLPLIAP